MNVVCCSRDWRFKGYNLLSSACASCGNLCTAAVFRSVVGSTEDSCRQYEHGSYHNEVVQIWECAWNLKKRTKNTCTFSALYFESRNDKFCLIDSADCASSDQPAQNNGLAEALAQVVMALSPDFGQGKNIVFFLTVHFKARQTTLFTASKCEKIMLVLNWPN